MLSVHPAPCTRNHISKEGVGLNQEIFMSTIFKNLSFKDKESIFVLDAPKSGCRTSLTLAERIEENHPL